MNRRHNSRFDRRAPNKGRAIILPPRMRREATADGLMRESPLTLETSRKAMHEMLKRFTEFKRGGAGSWIFSDEERLECLSEAINLLTVVRQGILETPNCMDKSWLTDALEMIGRAFDYLPRVPPEGTREAKLWIENGDLDQAVRDLMSFWRSYKPKFENLDRLLHHHGSARKYSPDTVPEAIADNGTEPTGGKPDSFEIPEDGGDMWESVADAAERAAEKTGYPEVSENYWKSWISRHCSNGKIKSNGLKGPDRRVSVRSLEDALKGWKPPKKKSTQKRPLPTRPTSLKDSH